MRKFIIDTDTGSDDAVALILAFFEKNIDILGITTVCGNISLELATKNALMTMEVCKTSVPLYMGASKPLFRELVTAVNVHGNDGMGDLDLIHPKTKPLTSNAVDFIIDTVRANPDEVEIISLGPVTNIALAILREPELMKTVKRIYSMGTAGFGHGNTTPVAEFNVYVDAESYSIMLNSGIPITIVGFDLCIGAAALNKEDMEYLLNLNEIGKFAAECNNELLNYNLCRTNEHMVDLPDAVAMGVALWEDIIKDSVDAYCHCCTKEKETYGQVIIYDRKDNLAIHLDIPSPNAIVIKEIDHLAFKEHMFNLFSKAQR